MRMSDGERKIMNVLWQEDGLTAKEISERLSALGWSRTTTYTMLSVCIEKGFLRREDPHFHCYSLISKEEASVSEAEELIDTRFDGATDVFVAALLGRKPLSKKQIENLHALLDEMDADR